MVTRDPARPEAVMSRRARRRSGAPQGAFVYGQYGSYPGATAGTNWHVGAATAAPPTSLTIRARSIAKLSPRRTSSASNGGRATLRNIHSVTALSTPWTRAGDRAVSAFRRAGETKLPNGSARTTT